MPDRALELESDWTTDGGEYATGQLLDLADPPSAIFAFNDMLAIGALHAARVRGVRVPEALSVVGFDDTFEASIVTPTLTTVRQPLAEMGRMAVALLVRLLGNQRIDALHVELETKLIIRESTAGPA
jgi:LacI family transcriptional regulator